MKINLDADAPDIRIELIPLIDVIFCILIFFILAAVGLTRQQAINLDLPRASTGAPQMREMMVVSIDPIGQVYVEKQPVTQEQLYQILLSYNKTKPEGLIVLNASQLVGYNQVIQVLDLLRSVGGDRVALATQPSNSPNPSSQNPGTLPLPTLDSPNSPNSGTSVPPQAPTAPDQIPSDSETVPVPQAPVQLPSAGEVPLSPNNSEQSPSNQ
jgi:biopolymer transport protein ExbD